LNEREIILPRELADTDLKATRQLIDQIRQKTVSPLVGEKDGGRSDLGQSGNTDASKLPEVFTEAKKYSGNVNRTAISRIDSTHTVRGSA